MKKLIGIAAVTVFAVLSLGACNNDSGDSKDGKTPGNANGHEYVDLGLSVCWATCNVGAETVSDYGNHYSWGELEPKSVYHWNTYEYYVKDSENEDSEGHFIDIGDEIGGTQYDVAHVEWGGDWRMPTYIELQELLNRCMFTFTSRNRVEGLEVRGPNGKTIFLPYAGYYIGDTDEPSYPGTNGSYWSGTVKYGDGESNAYYFVFGKQYRADYTVRYCGNSVRPVLPKK